MSPRTCMLTSRALRRMTPRCSIGTLARLPQNDPRTLCPPGTLPKTHRSLCSEITQNPSSSWLTPKQKLCLLLGALSPPTARLGRRPQPLRCAELLRSPAGWGLWAPLCMGTWLPPAVLGGRASPCTSPQSLSVRCRSPSWVLIKADLIVNASLSQLHQDEPDDCRSLGGVCHLSSQGGSSSRGRQVVQALHGTGHPQSRGSPWGPQGLLAIFHMGTPPRRTFKAQLWWPLATEPMGVSSTPNPPPALARGPALGQRHGAEPP